MSRQPKLSNIVSLKRVPPKSLPTANPKAPVAQGLRRPRFSFFIFTVSKSTAPRRQQAIQSFQRTVDNPLADLISHIRAEHSVEPRAKPAAASGDAALVWWYIFSPHRACQHVMSEKVQVLTKAAPRGPEARDFVNKSPHCCPKSRARNEGWPVNAAGPAAND